MLWCLATFQYRPPLHGKWEWCEMSYHLPCMLTAQIQVKLGWNEIQKQVQELVHCSIRVDRTATFFLERDTPEECLLWREDHFGSQQDPIYFYVHFSAPKVSSPVLVSRFLRRVPPFLSYLPWRHTQWQRRLIQFHTLVPSPTPHINEFSFLLAASGFILFTNEESNDAFETSVQRANQSARERSRAGGCHLQPLRSSRRQRFMRCMSLLQWYMQQPHLFIMYRKDETTVEYGMWCTTKLAIRCLCFRLPSDTQW
jgi:hypothetical protein